MVFVRTVVVFLSLIALTTGAVDIVVGVHGQANIGVGQPAVAPVDPVLDSQIRFLGAIWLGFGAIQLACLRDLKRRALLLELCFAILILGGFGRALAIARSGLPAGGTGVIFIVAALAIELTLVPAAWIVLRYSCASERRKSLK
jgi:hypothetical protein